MSLSRYRTVWIIALFDLPTRKAEQRKAAATFRKQLLKEGFTMLQLSVYARPCPGEEGARSLKKRLRSNLPAEGHVRLISITDHQYSRMEVFLSQKKRPVAEAPSQLELF